MTGRLNKSARYRAVLARNTCYDGIFYFAVKATRLYCRPSCPSPHILGEKNYTFFKTIKAAKSQGYAACRRCYPDRLNNNLSQKILDGIDKGAVDIMGVRGLADSLHISERHLRRIVHARTGTSPLRHNKNKRLNTAKHLTMQTDLPIVDVAFSSGFSSLRQFNDDFKTAFKTSPRTLRKTTQLAPAFYTAILSIASHD